MNTSHSFGSFARRLFGNVYLDPVRDWLLVCILSATALVGIFVWNVWAFNTVVRGGVIGIPSSNTSPVFSRSSLDTIHAIFASRAEEEAKYRTGTYRYADPSQ